MLLLLLLSCFSRVRLCATLQMAAHQAPPSLGFSRQEHWSGVPFPSPMHESEKWKWSRSVVSDSSRPHGLQPTSFSVHGIFQARILEWGAITFSGCLCYRTLNQIMPATGSTHWSRLNQLLRAHLELLSTRFLNFWWGREYCCLSLS